MQHESEARPRVRPREAGFSVIEVTVAAAIFALALMSTGLTLLHGSRHQAESAMISDSLRAVRDVCAEMQELANRSQDLTSYQGVGAIYMLYNGLERPVPGLPNGTISVTIHGNEALVPLELGGPQDLNFDGDAADDLTGLAAGTDLEMIPCVLTVTYTDERGTMSETYHRRIVRTSE